MIIRAMHLENYKCFNNFTMPMVDNLTILAGVNNIGKTTIIKSIIDFFKVNTESFNTVYNPSFVNYKSKINEHDTKKSMIFEYEIEFEKSVGKICIEFQYNENKKYGEILLFEANIIDKETAEVTHYLKLHKQEGKNSKYNISSKKMLVPFYLAPKAGVDLPFIYECSGTVVFIGYIPYKVFLEIKENDDLKNLFDFDEEVEKVEFGLSGIRYFIDKRASIKYIGPLRSNPQEYYLLGENNLNIESDGSNIVEVYNEYKDKNIKYYKTPSGNELIEESLEEAIKYWFEYFFGKNTTFEIKDTNENQMQIFINGHTINHSGFGFSQLLPIIIQGLLLDSKDLLLLEQPEIHLYPSLEMKLAEFLLCLAKNQRQIIAETHSEHIINQLVLCRVDDPVLNNLFGIYFLKNKDSEHVEAEKIIIDDRGEIINWPKGFFDQYVDFTYILMQKRKNLAMQKKNAK
ncbi:MAG: DUF3696 domain-containing protein [Campylobacteraceae bacterium]|nr:DUF3696 domain-containing protein [Campylobacteraceae bacterium]